MRRVVIAAAVLALTGCGTVAGSPVADTVSTGGGELFDPCELPADALQAAEVNPTVLSSDFMGRDIDEWKPCTWAGPWYYLNVLSTTRTFDEIQNNPSSYGFAPVVVGDRTAVSYQSKNYPGGLMCDVAFAWSRGSVVIEIDTMASKTKLEDPCVVAARTANTLDGVLPR